MDTVLRRTAAARQPPSEEARPRARLVCLSAPRLESSGGTLALEPWLDTEPLQLLLRVVAAGPEGMPVERLRAAMWPAEPVREGRRRLDHCLRCIGFLLRTAGPPIRVTDGIAAVSDEVLQVDSLALERGLAPLTDAFGHPTTSDVANARELLGRTVGGDCVFLPGCQGAWAEVARCRMADAMARVARRLASLPCAELSSNKGEQDEDR